MWESAFFIFIERFLLTTLLLYKQIPWLEISSVHTSYTSNIRYSCRWNNCRYCLFSLKALRSGAFWCVFDLCRSRLLSWWDARCTNTSGAPHKTGHITREPVPVLHWMVRNARTPFCFDVIFAFDLSSSCIHLDPLMSSDSFEWIVSFSFFRCPFWWRVVFRIRGIVSHLFSLVKKEDVTSLK